MKQPTSPHLYAKTPAGACFTLKTAAQQPKRALIRRPPHLLVPRPCTAAPVTQSRADLEFCPAGVEALERGGAQESFATPSPMVFLISHGLKASFPSFDSSLLFLTLTQSRQAWTNTIFKRFALPEGAHDGLICIAEGVRLIIGPHIFSETKFFLSQPDSTIAFELKEASGTLWVFPKDSRIEPINWSPPFEILSMFALSPEAADEIQKYKFARTRTPASLSLRLINASSELVQFLQLYTSSGPTETLLQQLLGKIASSRPPTPDYASFAGIVPFKQPSLLSDSILFRKGSGMPLPKSRNFLLPSSNSAGKEAAATNRRGSSDSADTVGGSYSPPTPRKQRSSIANGTSIARKESLSGAAASADQPSDRSCTYCGTRFTPMWRRGPDGAGTLCNACGVRWKSGKLSQGKRSPTKSEEPQLEEEAQTPPVQAPEYSIPSPVHADSEPVVVSAPLKKRRT